MRRRALIVGLFLICATSCGALALTLRSQEGAALILPGATNLVRQQGGFGELRLRYEVAGEPFDWRRDLGDRLEQTGWRGRSYTNMGARRPPFVTVWYTRARTFGPLRVVERAVLGGDPDAPNTALIDFSREIYFGERRLLGGRDCLLCF